MKSALCLLLLLAASAAVLGCREEKRLKKGKGARGLSPFEEYQVVPDVIDTPPNDKVKVKYGKGIKAQYGNLLSPTQVRAQPKFEWDAKKGDLYTLLMIDPDAPSRLQPTMRSFVHLLVGNIPGNNIPSGETFFEYIGSAPPNGTGLHRYVSLVYRQPGRVKFGLPTVTNKSSEGRANFTTRDFSKKWGLGNPIAGNFYQAQWDEYVPTLEEQIN